MTKENISYVHEEIGDLAQALVMYRKRAFFSFIK
jgi:hypothetical protein